MALSKRETIFQRLQNISKMIGNTPLLKLDCDDAGLYVKLEQYNAFGSIKDRPAFYVINNALTRGDMDENSIVVESSSGNFAIALANICNIIGLDFIPVIDPNITSEKENILRLLCKDVCKVTELDETGGYLLSRLKAVEEYKLNNSRIFHPNQYGNNDNYLAYYNTLGVEICNQFERLDYLVMSVSTGGSVTGISLRVREKFPNVKIVAVDVEGSVIFGGNPKKRKITGMGASIRTPFFDNALIDEIMILSQREIVNGCHALLKEQGIFSGASTGAAYYGALKKSRQAGNKDANILFIAPDSGNAYVDNVYNEEWIEKYINQPKYEVV
jgi:2,3-diaminopropionate biosynthesis protein SbnA